MGSSLNLSHSNPQLFRSLLSSHARPAIDCDKSSLFRCVKSKLEVLGAFVIQHRSLLQYLHRLGVVWVECEAPPSAPERWASPKAPVALVVKASLESTCEWKHSCGLLMLISHLIGLIWSYCLCLSLLRHQFLPPWRLSWLHSL